MPPSLSVSILPSVIRAESAALAAVAFVRCFCCSLPFPPLPSPLFPPRRRRRRPVEAGEEEEEKGGEREEGADGPLARRPRPPAPAMPQTKLELLGVHEEGKKKKRPWHDFTTGLASSPGFVTGKESANKRGWRKG